eukprot:15462502-Alexandrium_andersonii.AAC.1
MEKRHGAVTAEPGTRQPAGLPVAQPAWTATPLATTAGQHRSAFSRRRTSPSARSSSRADRDRGPPEQTNRGWRAPQLYGASTVHHGGVANLFPSRTR